MENFFLERKPFQENYIYVCRNSKIKKKSFPDRFEPMTSEFITNHFIENNDRSTARLDRSFRNQSENITITMYIHLVYDLNINTVKIVFALDSANNHVTVIYVFPYVIYVLSICQNIYVMNKQYDLFLKKSAFCAFHSL